MQKKKFQAVNKTSSRPGNRKLAAHSYLLLLLAAMLPCIMGKPKNTIRVNSRHTSSDHQTNSLFATKKYVFITLLNVTLQYENRVKETQSDKLLNCHGCLLNT